jgi:hypothetical protein
MKGPTRGPGSAGSPATRAQPKHELYGLAELCDLVGWPHNHKDRLRAKLPPADYTLRMGPIWKASTIDRWLLNRREDGNDRATA